MKTQLHSFFLALLFLTGCSLLLSSAKAEGIQANGMCEFGNCTSANVLPEGGSLSKPFSFTYTFANSDSYRATGSFGASNLSNSTGYIEITASDITLTYLGNNSHTASGLDTLQIDFLQYFQTPFRDLTNSNGFESVGGSFGGPLANASSVEARGISNSGTAEALMGPFYPPKSFQDSRTNQPGTLGPISLIDFRDTLTFGAGSGAGATIAVSNTPQTPTPEPSSLLLLSLGALLLGCRFECKARSYGLGQPDCTLSTKQVIDG